MIAFAPQAHVYFDLETMLERQFVDAISGKTSIVRTAAQHLRTLACTFAAYDAAALGTAVPCGA